MPLYEYLCGSCGHRFERIQKFSDPPATDCPSCGAGPVEKLVSSPAFQFKGTGWYVTDYAKAGKESAKADKSSKTSEVSSTSGSESTSKADAAASKTPAPSSAPKADSAT